MCGFVIGKLKNNKNKSEAADTVIYQVEQLIQIVGISLSTISTVTRYLCGVSWSF